MSSPVPASSMITTAILAGGESLRLGGNDKGLMRLRGKPLIEWVIATLADDKGSRIVVVANRNLAQYACHADVISDLQPGHRGPLAGIAAALSVCSTAWLYTVPVDCPTPPRGLREFLWREATESGVEAVVAHDGERRQPLFGLYRPCLAQSAIRAVAAGLGVSRWQDAMVARECVFPATEARWNNLNTATDFERFATEVCQ